MSETHIHSLIKDAIANDYESFEMVVHEVSAWSLQEGQHATEAQIRDALFELIECGYAKAYNLSPRSHPKEINLSELPRVIESAYYLLTEDGKKSISYG